MARQNVFVKLSLVVVCFALVVLFVAYRVSNNTAGQDDSGDRLAVTATFYPLYDFARQVGGDKALVFNITPAGTEPHDFEPSPQQLSKAAGSDVFVYLGNGFEPWASNFLRDNRLYAIQATEGLDPAPDGQDPHVWLDPAYAQQIVTRIADALASADPPNRDYYMTRADGYRDQLGQLDEDFKNGLASCRTRSIITAHDAFGYVAKRYNLDVYPIAGLSPEQEPDAATLARLTSLAKEKQVSTVFFESLTSPKLAETLATEAGISTSKLDPIEGITDEDQASGKDYLAIQRENLQNLSTALACQ